MAQTHSRSIEAKSDNNCSAPNAAANLVALIDEAIALVPGTEVEIALLERYGSGQWKERMRSVREKLLEVRNRAAIAP